MQMMTLTLGKTFIHRERKEEVESRTTLNQLKNDTYSSQTLMLHTRLKESGFANSTSHMKSLRSLNTDPPQGVKGVRVEEPIALAHPFTTEAKEPEPSLK